MDWFKSYLSDYSQCVKIGSILTDAKTLLFGVPQCSVLGSILFSLCTTPLSKVIQNHPGIGFHFQADDMQLYVHVTHKHVAHSFDKLKSCLDEKLQCEKLNKSFPVNILCALLSPVGAVKNLGVWLNNDFSFLRHVQNIYKSCFAQIRDLKHLRGYLTCHAALMAANALVGSKLDCCNSLFRSLLALDLHKL